MPNHINKASLPPNLYRLLSAIFSNNHIWRIVPNYELRHLHCTNWRLYFSSWSPKGNLRIFLISSPANQIIIVLSSRYISTKWLALSNNWGQDYNERHLTVFTFPLRTGLTMTRKQQKQLEFMKLLISFLSYTDRTVVREWWPHHYMIGDHSLLLGSI